MVHRSVFLGSGGEWGLHSFPHHFRDLWLVNSLVKNERFSR